MNPVTRILFVVIVSVPLLVSLDVVSAGTTLLLEVVTLPLWCGPLTLSARKLVLVALTIGAAVVMSGIVTLLYGRAGGADLVVWGPVRVSELSASLAVATAVRVTALVLPAVMVFATLDIAELADALVHIAGLPVRFVWGAVAGLRLIELTSTDFRQVQFARRARGLPTGPVRALFPLLVLSLGRAESLAMAMDARAFDTGAHPGRERTSYRTSNLSWRDGLGVGVALVIAATATTVSISMGAWHFVLQ